ncbi:MAG: phenylacetate-CoA oxygenase/reductase subunit PaaK [Bacteroidetes bacterium]|nr:phenylacetate-CoA oxygenase/reductase subunit PaaK [Bacteroidota bacterium]
MAVHFHQLKIKKIIKETPDCVSVIFEIPGSMASEFQYKEGQNITIKKIWEEEELRRTYSICNAPYEEELKVAIKKTEGGRFSAFANDVLKQGDVLEVMPPSGKFNAKTGAGNFLAIAAGSGITPIISIIKHTLKTQPASSFTLIYANKTRQSIIFFEELEGLKNKYMNRFNLLHILSRERTDAAINYGHIDKEKLDALQQQFSFKNFNDIYLCGPEEMIFNAAKYFDAIGITKDKIHYELFTTPGIKQSNVAGKIIEENNGAKSHVSIKLDGRSIDFLLPYNSDSILDAALKQGADLPYACKGGVCCTCRARLLEGKVHMDVNYALEDEELEQGFILTCQSHPLTENVVIDFDVK